MLCDYFFLGQIPCRRRRESARVVLAHFEGELVVFVAVCVHQYQICAANGELRMCDECVEGAAEDFFRLIFYLRLASDYSY